MPQNKIFRVTLSVAGIGGAVYSTRVRVNTYGLNTWTIRADARNAAIKKLFGTRAYWWPDSGLSGYGQVMKPGKYGGSDCITPTGRLDIQ